VRNLAADLIMAALCSPMHLFSSERGGARVTGVCAAQAVNGGSPTYFNIPLPFDLTTLLAIVRLHFSR